MLATILQTAGAVAFAGGLVVAFGVLAGLLFVGGAALLFAGLVVEGR